MTLTILSLVSFSDAHLDKLRAVSPRLRVAQFSNSQPADIPADLRQSVDILYGWGKPAAAAHHYPRLKWLQTHSAGIDYLLEQPIWESDIPITSMNGVHAVPMAEYVLGMMLAFRWQIAKMLTFQQQARWPDGRWDEFSRPELRDSTLGIVGYGAIGRELARQAGGLGMRILAVNSNGQRSRYRGYHQPGLGDPDAEIPDRLYPAGELTQMLPDCDYVVILAPLTANTHHLFNAETLARLKPTAVLLNLARGGLVDEAALEQSLREKQITGAALDVFESEPLPADSPLWTLDNVIISPHVSGFTPKYDDRATDLFAENLRRFLDNKPLINRVNRQRGY